MKRTLRGQMQSDDKNEPIMAEPKAIEEAVFANSDEWPQCDWQDEYMGPCRLPCEHKCTIPPGLKVAMVPKTRHAWNDVLPCPMCDWALLILERPKKVEG